MSQLDYASRDVSTTEAALMATAAATLAHLQTIRQGMAAVFAEERVGVARIRRGNRRGRYRFVELGLESGEEPNPAKCTRVSRPRPDYETFTWGVMLASVKALHLTNQFLLPAPKPQRTFLCLIPIFLVAGRELEALHRTLCKKKTNI